MIETSHINPQTYLLSNAGSDYGLLYRIIECESGWNPDASNPNSTARGLAQFISSTWKQWGSGDVYDPYKNIDAMIRLYKAQGTLPWKSSQNCWNRV